MSSTSPVHLYSALLDDRPSVFLIIVAQLLTGRLSVSPAGCHANGGNVLAAGKSLRLEDLQRNQVAEINEIYSLVYSGKGKMPGFGKDCAPAGQCTFAARLSDEEVSGLAEYVDQRARDGWN